MTYAASPTPPLLQVESLIGLFHKHVSDITESKHAAQVYAVGDECEAKYRHKVWKAGKVTEYSGEAKTYTITFDNGAVESGIPAHFIRPKHEQATYHGAPDKGKSTLLAELQSKYGGLDSDPQQAEEDADPAPPPPETPVATAPVAAAAPAVTSAEGGDGASTDGTRTEYSRTAIDASN